MKLNTENVNYYADIEILEDKEVWRDVVGYEGYYQVSDYGRVRNVKFDRILKPYMMNNGYLFVHLCKEGQDKDKSVHRIVAEAFLSNPNSLATVNHKDYCKTHNYVTNIEWMSLADNLRYTHNKAVQCIETGEVYPSCHEAGRQLDIWQTSISSCCRGKLKSAGGLHFQYLQK